MYSLQAASSRQEPNLPATRPTNKTQSAVFTAEGKLLYTRMRQRLDSRDSETVVGIGHRDYEPSLGWRDTGVPNNGFICSARNQSEAIPGKGGACFEEINKLLGGLLCVHVERFPTEQPPFTIIWPEFTNFEYQFLHGACDAAEHMATILSVFGNTNSEEDCPSIVDYVTKSLSEKPFVANAASFMSHNPKDADVAARAQAQFVHNGMLPHDHKRSELSEGQHSGIYISRKEFERAVAQIQETHKRAVAKIQETHKAALRKQRQESANMQEALEQADRQHEHALGYLEEAQNDNLRNLRADFGRALREMEKKFRDGDRRKRDIESRVRNRFMEEKDKAQLEELKAKLDKARNEREQEEERIQREVLRTYAAENHEQPIRFQSHPPTPSPPLQPPTLEMLQGRPQYRHQRHLSSDAASSSQDDFTDRETGMSLQEVFKTIEEQSDREDQGSGEGDGNSTNELSRPRKRRRGYRY